MTLDANAKTRKQKITRIASFLKALELSSDVYVLIPLESRWIVALCAKETIVTASNFCFHNNGAMYHTKTSQNRALCIRVVSWRCVEPLNMRLPPVSLQEFVKNKEIIIKHVLAA